MKVAEMNDPKEELKKKSETYRTAVEEEVKLLGDRTGRALTNVLIVTGALAVSYLVFRQFLSTKSRSKSRRKRLAAAPEIEEEEDRTESRFATMMADVGTVLATQAGAFLLALAREKLVEYLKTQSGENKPVAHEHS